MHLAILTLHILINRRLVKLLVGVRILGVDVDFVISKDYALWWIFIKDYVEGDLLGVHDSEEVMSLHLLPCEPLFGFKLHRLIKEVETLE